MTTPGPACVNGCRDDDGEKTRTRDTTWTACDECHRKLRRWCADIPTLYALLPYVLERGSVDRDPYGKAGGKHGEPAHPPIPIRPDVADLRDERREGRADEARGTLGIVEGWARLVREERDLTTGGLATVVSETGLLLAHSDWICKQGWVDQCMAEIGYEHRMLAHACGEHGVKPVATCRTLLDQDAPTECGGPIMPTKIGMGARCGRCGRYWGEHELSRLGLVEASSQAASPQPHSRARTSTTSGHAVTSLSA